MRSARPSRLGRPLRPLRRLGRVYARVVSSSFVPDDFVVPTGLAGRGFRLEPLGPQHNDADHRAWTTSIEHIRATPGFARWSWPPAGGMSLEENLRDLQRHADDFQERIGFTYTVLDDDDVVIGCVYIYPSKANPEIAEVRSWVTVTRAELDLALHRTVAAWLAADWPFAGVEYRDGGVEHRDGGAEYRDGGVEP